VVLKRAVREFRVKYKEERTNKTGCKQCARGRAKHRSKERIRPNKNKLKIITNSRNKIQDRPESRAQ
jgi:DNA replicative helicase MCM subunit Mcm2 (Cdc46/Mcm family)